MKENSPKKIVSNKRLRELIKDLHFHTTKFYEEETEDDFISMLQELAKYREIGTIEDFENDKTYFTLNSLKNPMDQMARFMNLRDARNEYTKLLYDRGLRICELFSKKQIIPDYVISNAYEDKESHYTYHRKDFQSFMYTTPHFYTVTVKNKCREADYEETNAETGFNDHLPDNDEPIYLIRCNCYESATDELSFSFEILLEDFLKDDWEEYFTDILDKGKKYLEKIETEQQERFKKLEEQYEYETYKRLAEKYGKKDK